MRPHGRANISPTNPRALAVCDRCGSLYNHYQLRWQFDWRGPRQQNLRILVCQSCYDQPQQNGQRTIILPPDPEPIQNARPEDYVGANNPLSGIGANPLPSLDLYSAFTGTMNEGGGIGAAFDGNINKPSYLSAMITVPGSSFDNYVAMNWAEYPGGTYPPGIDTPVITHALSAWQINAPNDSTFNSSSYVIQGSNINGAWTSWTTLSSGSIMGFVGEVISGTAAGGSQFQFHRVAFWGGGGFPIAVAQVQFNVADTATMTTS